MLSAIEALQMDIALQMELVMVFVIYGEGCLRHRMSGDEADRKSS